MIARPRATLVALLASLQLAATFMAPLPAFAAPGAEAGEHFRHGVQLYKENDFAAALIEFQRAYDIDPKFQVLYNIAEAHYQLQDYASALKTFQRYVDEGGRKIPPQRRKDVEAEIATLSKRVAKLIVVTSDPGATVTVDDVVVGTSPLDPITVSAGRRRVTATLRGRTPATKIVDLAGGDEQTVRLDIAAVPGPIVITEAGPPPPPPEEPSMVPMVVAWSATGALTIGAVITGVVALGASSDVEEELGRFPGDREALASASSSASTFGLVTDILIVGSVIGAGVATYFTVDFVLASEAAAGEEPESEEPESDAHLRVHPLGVTLDGTF